jgi:apolipoprotein N-acyltransferase
MSNCNTRRLLDLLKIDSTSRRALTAGILLWAAFPPLNIWPLAIVSIAIYLSMIDREHPLTRREYFSVWIGASLCWLGLLQGIRLAFWPLYAGWMALSLYLAVYTVSFVGLSRVLVHRWRWPLAWAAPCAWISLELARGYVISGFSSCLLGHVVVEHPVLIQIAAQLGSYGISGSLVLLAVVLYFVCSRFSWLIDAKASRTATARPSLTRHETYQILTALVVLGLVVGYGLWEVKRTKQISAQRSPLFTAALIQENTPTIFDMDPERSRERSVIAWDNYIEQTRLAAAATERLDLVVWPESAFTKTSSVFDWDGSRTLPAALVEEGLDVGRLEEFITWAKEQLDEKISRVFQATGRSSESIDRPYLLLGNDVVRIQGEAYDQFNAALWVSPDGKMLGYYAKQHLVMFGEYIPIATYFPAICRSLGLPNVSAGQQAASFEINDKARIAPSICFENVLPHVIRRQIQDLERQDKSPDVMVNITNDGWFRGSSISDHHFANATLTSVENRRPMLIAANTGLSAWVDGGGNRVAVTTRLKGEYIIAEPKKDGRWGLWQSVGDWPVRLVAALCFLLWIAPALFASRGNSSVRN